MNETIKQLNKVKASMNLSDSSRARIRSNLTKYMDRHPAHSSAGGFKFAHIMNIVASVIARPLPLVAALCAVVIVAGGTTAYAAEKALPGNVLYGWKTGVNERVQLALMQNEDRKVEFEMVLATRRLDEADVLARAGLLGEAEQEQIQANFEWHVSHVQNHVGELERNHQDEVARTFKQKFTTLVSLSQHHLLSSVQREDEIVVEPAGPVNIGSQINATDNAILSTQAIVDLETHSERTETSDVNNQKKENIKKASQLLQQARVQLKSGNQQDAVKLNQEAIKLNRQVLHPDEFKNNRGQNREEKDDSGSGIVPKLELRWK